MEKVVIYTTRFCPFCIRAKHILGKHNIEYKEIPVDGNPQLREDMTRKANGQYTVPQIWIGETHVGGCTELMAVEAAGELPGLLEAAEQ